jgi:acetyltransferase-like isoleucine patch superfamily enzyme
MQSAIVGTSAGRFGSRRLVGGPPRPGTKLLNKDLMHVSIARSLYLSLRFGGKIVILRGTRLRLDRGARIRVPRDCRLVIGKHHAGGAPSSLDMRRNARLTINGSGRVSMARGTRVLVLTDAHLEIGAETVINFSTTITCFTHIRIGLNSGIGWNSNVFDGNAHELTVDGVPRPASKPVSIGDHVWVGSGVTILGATIGDGAVVGAGSVVVSAVPSKALVAGNPARIIGKNVSFKWY